MGVPAIRDIIGGLIAQGVGATCVTTDLEAGYSGRDRREVEAVAARRRSAYVVLPINEAIAERARQVQRRMG